MNLSGSEKRKIAFWFRYGPTENAKLFIATPDILEALSLEYEVHYYGLRGPDDKNLSWGAGVHFHILPININRASNASKLISTILWVSMLPFLAFHCRWKGISAIYIDDVVPFAGFWAQLICGPPVAITIADLMLESYARYFGCFRPLIILLKRLEAYSWKRASVIFVRSKAAVSILHEKYNIPFWKMVPIYDACDFAVFKPGDRVQARKEIQIVPDNALVVCYHGVLHPNKGLDRVLVEMTPLLRSNNQLHFIIIGNGVEYKKLRKLAHDLNLVNQVHFTGYMASGRVATYIHASDIGLVCRSGSLADNLVVTSVLGRYMASAIPVVASRVAGIAEIIEDGVNGLLYDPKSDDEFSAKLELLIGDVRLRKRLAEAGYATAVRYFDRTSTTEQTVSAVKNMLNI